MKSIQVDKFHYRFSKYVDKRRWLSIWHQLDEVLALEPSTVLEVGPGPGIFKVLLKNYHIGIETVDIDPELKPDYVASAKELPLKSNTYECVCAFQVLEHLPYEQALKAFSEMVRVSKSHVIISIPHTKRFWVSMIDIPKLGEKRIQIPKPRLSSKQWNFDAEHHWEINRQSFPLRKVVTEFSKYAEMLVTYRLSENPRQRFFIFKKFSNNKTNERDNLPLNCQ